MEKKFDENGEKYLHHLPLPCRSDFAANEHDVRVSHDRCISVQRRILHHLFVNLENNFK